MIDISSAPTSASEHAAPRAASAGNTPPLGDRFDFWRTAHRALRGRYRVALLLAFSGAVAGALAGWIYGKQIYCATGLVRIASVLPAMIRQTDQNQPIAMFDGFMQAQREVMTSREIIQIAMRSESWRRVETAAHISSPEQFAASLKVEARPRTDYLRVTFRSPDAEVACAGVQSIVTTYQHKYEREQEQFEKQRMNELNGRRAVLTAEVQNLESDIGQIRQKHLAAELETLYASVGERVRKLQIALAEVQSALAGAPDATQQTSTHPPGGADSDEMLRSYALDQTRAESQLEQARTRGLGPAHPLIISLEASVERVRQRVACHTQEYDMRRAERSTGPSPLPLQERETNLQQLIESTNRELQELAVQRALLKDFEEKLGASRLILSETERRIDALTTEASLGSRLTVINKGEKPMTAVLDNRAKFAGAGGFAGAAGPILVLILGSILRCRYRFSDELAQDLLARVPFVAALPAVHCDGTVVTAAAHCVHQLRIQMQPREFSEAGPCNARTYLITSASAEEGKSSLSLALGLSFAAAGFRTLLIDSDLTSRGLTGEVEAKESSGLIEAAAGGKMVVRRLRSGLSVMASGQAHKHDALTLAPDALMKVLAAVREQFDVVLIDSDPILTGVMASIVAPQVDGVILAISRGQRQPLVRGAVRQLEMLGAQLLGIVFNRAAASEMHRLLSEQLQSPAGEERVLPSRLERFGPLVKAVLASLMRSREDDLDFLPDGLAPARTDDSKTQHASLARTA